MSYQDSPKWWQLCLTFLLLMALFAVDSRLKISTRGHQVVQTGIVLLVYGLIHLWMKANSTALSRMDRRQYNGGVTVIRISPSQLPDSYKDNHSMLQLPDSEIKCILSDTYEMDYIDVESFPVDEVSQDLKKE